MNHKHKLKLARRLLTKAEGKAHIPPFQSHAWEKRKEDREARVRNREIMAQYRKAGKEI